MVYQISYMLGRPSQTIPKPITTDYVETDQPIYENHVRKFLRNEGFKGATILQILPLTPINCRYFWGTIKTDPQKRSNK